MTNEYALGGPPPQSRSEKILMNQNPGPAQSRIEELLKNASVLPAVTASDNGKFLRVVNGADRAECRGGELLMAEYIIQDSTLTDIADAIRAKDGSSAPILTEDMADAIAAIPSGTTITDGIVVKARDRCQGEGCERVDYRSR